MKNQSVNINNNNGFTIVELLVVIVVIGILAAITIVSYTGISAKAKTARAQSNAVVVSRVASVYYIDPLKNAFPTQATLIGHTTGITKIPSGIHVIVGGANVLSSANNDTDIAYQNHGTTGGCIGYYDTAFAGVKYIYVGDAKAASLNIAALTCS